MRKAVEFALCVCLVTIPTFGQNTTSANPNTTIQCRSLDGSRTAIQPDEKLIGDQVCKSVLVQTFTPTQAASPNLQATPKQDFVPPSSVPAASVPTPAVEIVPNSVFITPMNGFE